MQTFITAYRDNDELFYGRILSADKGLDGRLEVTCEGGLTFFLDSEQEKLEVTKTTDAFMRGCVTAHNSQVEKAKQFSVGMISPPSQYDGKAFPFNITSYTVTQNVFESLILSRLGGYLRIRPGNNGMNYLDYVEDYGQANTQPVKVEVKIEDKNDNVSGENIFTVLRLIAKGSGENNGIIGLCVKFCSILRKRSLCWQRLTISLKSSNG